ncbi:MAG: hypothetical protein DSM106950_16490 [Stigonema ocellatum SAG 48.90 = DSM 106950]|nr:hypothetical protein [Stigonema ocellatum SAG 48.90 = DSM 106950]
MPLLLWFSCLVIGEEVIGVCCLVIGEEVIGVWGRGVWYQLTPNTQHPTPNTQHPTPNN